MKTLTLKFRDRLTLILILMVSVSVFVSGIFVAQMIKQSHMSATRDSMIREAKMVVATVPWKTDGSLEDRIAYFNGKAAELKKIADARVTFIQADGTVLGDSDRDPHAMENHLSRPEVQGSLSEGVGSASRHSASVGTNMYYVALKEPGGQGFVRLAVSLKSLDSVIRKLWLMLIGGLLLLLLAAGLVSYRIASGLTRPLEKITKVARQITNMEYKSRVNIRNTDEIGLLGQAINTMADSLQLQMNRIMEDESRLKSVIDNIISGVVLIDKDERIMLMNRAAEDILGAPAKQLLGLKYTDAKQQQEFTGMINDCLERKEHLMDEIVFYYPQERMLEIHMVPMTQPDDEWNGIVVVLHDITAIRRLERMRSEFVANVSHELKTPVAAVKGFAETLLSGAVKDEETSRSFLQIIYDESDRLNRLIGDILELSKIESKRVPLLFSPVHLHSFVAKMLEVMRNAADKKQITLEMDIDEELYLEADEDRLMQIIINLLSNGISYTPEGGRVKVTAAPEQFSPDGEYETIQLTIADTGIGIPKKDLPRIFERFYRVDKARSRSSGGTGLGLSIVKHLVEQHKGTIRVDSELGVGTRMIIDLPVIH